MTTAEVPGVAEDRVGSTTERSVPTDQDPAADLRRSAPFLAMVVLPALVLGVLGWRRRWISDDGMIYIRPVRQILAGHGPVFNVGERAEVATSALWQWLLALGSALTTLDPVRVAIYGGLALTMIGFGLAAAGTWRFAGPGVRIPAAVLVAPAVPPFWDYATSGLETGLTFAWAGSIWFLLTGLSARSSRGSLLAYAVIVGLGPLVRPELAVVAAAFLLAGYLVVRPSRRTAGVLLAAAGALPLTYQVFRMGFYGVLTPLPGLTKEAGASDWSRGGRYLTDFLGTYWLWVFVLIVPLLLIASSWGAHAERSRSVVAAAPVTAGLLLFLYTLRVGGDWMHARMLLLPTVLVLLPVLIVSVPGGWTALRDVKAARSRGEQRWWAATATASGAVVVLLWAGLALTVRPPFDDPASLYEDVRQGSRQLTGTYPTSADDWRTALPDLNSALLQAEREGRPTLLAFGYDARVHPVALHPQRRIAPGDIAATAGYLGAAGAVVPLDEAVVDHLSLGSPLGAHLEIERAIWPGHEKLLSTDWVLADLGAPGAAVPTEVAWAAPPERVLAARRVLACGRVAELQASVREPLTAGRFLRNLWGAPKRTALRIPRDPVRAEEIFCR